MDDSLNEDSDQSVDSLPPKNELPAKEGAKIGPDGLQIETYHIEEESHDELHEESQEEKPEDVPGPARVRRFATLMNCMNTLLGAGILSLPLAYHHCGIIPSTVMLAIIGALSHVGSVMLMKLAARKKIDAFDQLGTAILGRWGGVCISIGTMLYCISCLTTYLLIGFGTIASWFDAGGIKVDDVLWKRVITILIYFFAIPFPLTFPRDIKFLSPFSTLTFIATLFFVIVMIIKAATILPYPPEKKPHVIMASFGMNIFSAISIFGMAFAMPVVILPVMKPYNPNSWKRSLISFWNIFIGFIFYIIPAITGYCLFGDDSKDVILDNFSSKDVLIIIVRAGFFIVVTCSYPAIALSLMESWGGLIFNDSNQQTMVTWKRLILIILTSIIPLAFALFLPRVGPALSIGGAFGGCLVDFFFPAIMWIKMSKKKLYHWQNILCILFAIFGLGSCAISTYCAILDAIDAFTS